MIESVKILHRLDSGMFADEYDIIGDFSTVNGLLTHNLGKPDKKEAMFNALETIFVGTDWSLSFSKTQLIIIDECYPAKVFCFIHKWLRTKCLDITNVVLVSKSHHGISAWWQQHCQIRQQKSFRIIELFTNNIIWRPKYLGSGNPTWHYWPVFFESMDCLPSDEFYQNSKNIKQLFSYYGGTHGNLERNYLSLQVLTLADIGVVDTLFEFEPKQKILDYVEYLTYYKDQSTVDSISSTYDKFVDKNLTLNKYWSNHYPHNAPDATDLKNLNWAFKSTCATDLKNLNWAIDSTCFVTVVRETHNDQPYSFVTEKTLRAFVHHTVVMPIGFNAVTELEKLGFFFPRDIIDYEYQSTPYFHDRVQQMLQALKKLKNNYSYQDLEQYYFDNYEKFKNNAKLAFASATDPLYFEKL